MARGQPTGCRGELMVKQLLACPLKSSPPGPGLGVDMISKMLKMQMLEDEDDLAYAETEKKARTDSTSDGRPAWMRTLHTTASNWLHLIPQTLSPLKRTVENIKVAGLGSACCSPGRQISEFEASLVYRVSSRIARAI